ncbi:MAG: SGNH/GDSL hydrolase family protein, partial [Phycisphaerales bacterium]
ILFVGDSVTCGNFVRAEDAWPFQVCEQLQAVCLNAGVCGYDTRQEGHYLRYEGLELHPDAVVLGFCMNDVSAQYNETSIQHPESRIGLVRLMSRAVARARWGPDLRAAGERIQQFGLAELCRDPETPRVTSAWRNVRDELAGIWETCRLNRLPMLVVGFPFRDQANARPNQRLSEICYGLGIKCVDLWGILPNSEFMDATHPTPEGHRLAAEAVAVDFGKAGSSEKNTVSHAAAAP